MSRLTVLNLLKLTKNQIKFRFGEQVCHNSTYKAAILKEHGKPLVIEKMKSIKKLQPRDVRIEVKYCSINYLDSLQFKNEKRAVPFIPGYEISGEVIEVGSDVKADVAIAGERVVALSLKNFAGCAEECIVDAVDVFRLPTHIDPREAAVVTYGHATALFAFNKICKTPPTEGSLILISCGPAGLGLAAVDVANSIYRAKVIGVCDSEERSAFIREKGAFAAFKFNKDLRDKILLKTENNGANIVYDAMGEGTLDTLSTCVAPHGIIMSVSVADPKHTVQLPPPNASFATVNLHTLRAQDSKLYRQIITDTLELADQGILSAHISAKFKLKQVNEAIQFIEKRQSTGKVLIEVDD